MLIIDQCKYSDLNYTEVTVGVPPLIVNREAIYYSLHNLITTVRGERLNLVTYGVDLPTHLFEIMDNNSADELRFAFIHAVEVWEPRVTMDPFNSVVTPYPDDNSYKIRLVFNLVGLDQSSLVIAGLYKKQFAKEF